jgi:MSHA pilin protein MshD
MVMLPSSTKRGATLMEAVVAIIVLGIAIPPLVALYTGVAARTADGTYQEVALEYAEAMLEEIASKSFDDPDVNAGSFGTEEGSRAAYDDVDDFDGLSESPPTRINGTALSQYGGFTRSVIVENVTAADPDPVTPATDGWTDYKRVTVTVGWTGGKGGQLALETLRTNLARPSPVDEAASVATAVKKSSKEFALNDLVSASSVGVEIASFSLSANVATTKARKLKLAGVEIWKQDAGVNLPTGVLAMNMGSSANRTLAAGGTPELRYEALTNPAGTITYTLILYFTNGARSVLVFPITWT